jgi:hypothetical protein
MDDHLTPNDPRRQPPPPPGGDPGGYYPPQDPYAWPGERNPFVKPEKSWIDRQFSETSLLVLIVFPFCCGLPAFVFGLLGTILCRDPIARRNAIIVLCISSAMIALAFFMGVLDGLAGRSRPGFR